MPIDDRTRVLAKKLMNRDGHRGELTQALLMPFYLVRAENELEYIARISSAGFSTPTDIRRPECACEKCRELLPADVSLLVTGTCTLCWSENCQRISDHSLECLGRQAEPEAPDAPSSVSNEGVPTVSKYHRTIKGVVIDVYDILDAYQTGSAAVDHVIKKGLMFGRRGHKDALQDLKEMRDSIDRAIEREQEKAAADAG